MSDSDSPDDCFHRRKIAGTYGYCPRKAPAPVSEWKTATCGKEESVVEPPEGTAPRNRLRIQSQRDPLSLLPPRATSEGLPQPIPAPWQLSLPSRSRSADRSKSRSDRAFRRPGAALARRDRGWEQPFLFPLRQGQGHPAARRLPRSL